MFDRLSGETHNTLEAARAEAGRLGHDFVGTEHLLLGLLDVGDDTAGALLAGRGVMADEVRSQVARAGALQQPPSELPPLSLTARAKQVMALAGKEADDLGNRNVAPAHLLLGIIRQGTGVAALVLKGFGVDLVALRDDLLAAMVVDSDAAFDGSGRRREAGGSRSTGVAASVSQDGEGEPRQEPPVATSSFVGPACPRCERSLSENLVVTEIAPQDSSIAQPTSSRLPKRSSRSGTAVIVVSCGACGYPLSVAR